MSGKGTSIMHSDRTCALSLVISIVMGLFHTHSYPQMAPKRPILDVAAAHSMALHEPLGLLFSAPARREASLGDDKRPAPFPPVVWTAHALKGIQKYRLNPLRAARLLAHLHAALHDAWAVCADAVATEEEPESDAAQCASVAQHVAGARVLQHFFPAETPGRYAAIAALAVAGSPGGNATSGFSGPGRDGAGSDAARTAAHLGHTAAWAAIWRALEDGADRSLSTPTRPGPSPGLWRPTPPLFAVNPTEAGAPRWRTWILQRADEVPVAAPLRYGSPAYLVQMQEVLDVRRSLTDAQRDIANRWNLDVGTVTPPGVWNRHAIDLATEYRLDAAAVTLLLAHLNLAMADAMVACWHVKLTWWTERPVTVIREQLDRTFAPHLVTPSFPGYPSGHSCASGAAAQVLAARIPEARDRVIAMSREAAMSRLYGGIHIRHDNDEGLNLGDAIGRLTVRRLGPGPESRLAPGKGAPPEQPAGE